MRSLRFAVLLLGVAVCACGGGDDDDDGGSQEPPFAAFFAEDVLATIELTIPQDCADALDREPYEYCEGSVRYLPDAEGSDELSFENVGIRLKGMGSFRDLDGKAAFKVKLDEYVDGQRMFGLRRITLNNMVQDPAMAHEALGYRFYRAAGVPAPLCNYLRVLVNDEYFGLYANVQTLDDEFAEHLYDPAPGNLYDTPNDEYFIDLLPEYRSDYELETNHEENDTSDLDELIDAVNGPDDTFYEDAGRRLDWQEWLTAGATQAIIADWDGYFGARNNYKLYHELNRDRFLLLPWGIDQTFGMTDGHTGERLYHLRYALDGSTSERELGVVFQNCQDDSTCWERYLDAVEAALAVWDALPLDQELDAILTLTEEARQDDTRRPYGEQQTEDALTALRSFLEQRADIVRDELETYDR